MRKLCCFFWWEKCHQVHSRKYMVFQKWGSWDKFHKWPMHKAAGQVMRNEQEKRIILEPAAVVIKAIGRSSCWTVMTRLAEGRNFGKGKTLLPTHGPAGSKLRVNTLILVSSWFPPDNQSWMIAWQKLDKTGRRRASVKKIEMIRRTEFINILQVSELGIWTLSSFLEFSVN